MQPRIDLLDALTRAARREYAHSNGADPWDSIFTKAITVLMQPNRQPGHLPDQYSFIAMFHSSYVCKRDSYSRFERILDYAFQTLFETMERRCRARSQSMGSSSKEVMDAVLCSLFSSRDRNPKVVSMDVAAWLYRWTGNFNIFTGNMLPADARKSFETAIVRWLWSTSKPSEIPDDVRKLAQEVVRVQKFNARNLQTYAHLLGELLLLPHHQPRSLSDTLTAVRAGIDIQLPDHQEYFYLLLAQPALEAALSITNRSHAQITTLTEANTFKAIYDLIAGVDPYGVDLYDDIPYAYREEKDALLNILLEIWRKICGVFSCVYVFFVSDHISDHPGPEYVEESPGRGIVMPDTFPVQRVVPLA